MQRTGDTVATFLLYLALIGTAAVAMLLVFGMAMNVGCIGPRCNYGLSGVSIGLMFFGALVTVIASLIVTAVRAHGDSPRSAWWVPAAALLVIVGLFVACVALHSVALDQPFPYIQ